MGRTPPLKEMAAGVTAALRMAWNAARGSAQAPWAISFLVTGRCSLRCKHCFYHYFKSTPKTELSLAEYERLSESLGPFPVAMFCGGEPFLRRDLGDIISMFRRNNGVHLASATTNGQHLKSVVEQTEAIVSAEPHKPFMLGISLEGPETIHDEVRGSGSFAKAIETFDACRRLRERHANLSLTATTVVNSINQSKAADFVRWAARRLEPNSHCILLVRQGPRDGDHLKEVDLRHYEAAQREAVTQMRQGRWWSRFRPDALYVEAVAKHVSQTRRTGVRSFHCHAGVHGALIDPIGRVQVCEALAEDPSVGHIGSLRDHDMDFHALWRTAEAEHARALVNRHEFCRSCTHETMGHAPSLVFPPNWLWPRMHGQATALPPAPRTDLVQLRLRP